MKAKPSKMIMIGLPYEATTSFLKGTGTAPDAIVEELSNMDGFDLSLGCNPFDTLNWEYLPAPEVAMDSPEALFAYGEKTVQAVLAEGAFPLGLGGEHTVSVGLIRGMLKDGPLGVVQIDAHGDLRDEYGGSPNSHACVMRRAVESGASLLGIGIRAICEEEVAFRESRNDVWTVDGRAARERTDWYAWLDRLPERIYLSIDVDGIDPLEMPGVGTPEPGGITYEKLCAFLKVLFAQKQVVGADVVELMPIPEDGISVRATARLIGLIASLALGNEAA